MKYYKVQAKCGHVGKNKYILKWFYVKAENGKDAAKIVRETPRVKHHQKYAIIEVVEIEFEEYCNGLKLMNSDMYFKVHNSSDQKIYNCVKPEEIYPEEKDIKYKKKRNGQRIRNELLDKLWKKEMQGDMYYYG